VVGPGRGHGSGNMCSSKGGVVNRNDVSKPGKQRNAQKQAAKVSEKGVRREALTGVT